MVHKSKLIDKQYSVRECGRRYIPVNIMDTSVLARMAIAPAFRERLIQRFLLEISAMERRAYLESGTWRERAQRVVNAFFLFLTHQKNGSGSCRIVLEQSETVFSADHFMCENLWMLTIVLSQRVETAQLSRIEEILAELFLLFDEYAIEIYEKIEAHDGVRVIPFRSSKKRQ